MIILAFAVMSAFIAVAYGSLSFAIAAYILVVLAPSLDLWRAQRRERADASWVGKLARAEVVGTWPRRTW